MKEIQLSQGRRAMVDDEDEERILALATATQNHQNRVKMSRNGKPPASLFKSVSLNNGKWLSRISVYGTRVHLGMFNFEIEAAAAYDSAAVEHHKEFAVLNLKLRRER